MTKQRLAAELERQHKDCYGWALCCCQGDRERAEDVLQTVYLKILQGRARFEGRSSLKTWLFAVVLNTARSQTRRWLRRLKLSLLKPNPMLSNNGSGDAEAALQQSQVRQRLEKLLRRLSARQRQVLHLVFYQDMTVEEASQVMQVSLGSARTHYHRGKARLRRLIDKEGLTNELR